MDKKAKAAPEVTPEVQEESYISRHCITIAF